MAKNQQIDLDQFLRENSEWVSCADLIVMPPSAEEAAKEFPELLGSELLRREYQYVKPPVTRLAFYIRLRREGTAHAMAEMFASQRAPGLETTDSFWQGRPHFSRVYGEDYANIVRSKLAARGVRLGPNDEYMPELARFRGDPEAVVSFDGARDYIRNLCERRGQACEGAVNVKHREPDHDPHDSAIPMAEDLVRKNAQQMVAKNPALARKSRREIREAVLAAHGPST